MKFKMIIDPTKEEEIVATVHEPSELTEKIRQLVQEDTGTDRIAAFLEEDIKKTEKVNLEETSLIPTVEI